MDVKACSRCRKLKPLTEFATRNDRASGYASHCKTCKCRSRGPAVSLEELADARRQETAAMYASLRWHGPVSRGMLTVRL
jgi:hypothetical protein